MTCETPYQRTLDWLITMAKHPGFKGHAWKRAEVLSADQSGMFTGISEALTAAILAEAGQDAPKVSGDQHLTKPR